MNRHPLGCLGRRLAWFQLCGFICLFLARPAQAVDPVWPPADQLGSVFNYSVPGNPPPQIDATTFDNENSFTINFTAATRAAELFETWDTINYTNNGLMVANSPLLTIGEFFSESPGCGFQFDQLSSSTYLNSLSGVFYNPGTIRANSIIDVGTNTLLLSTIGKIIVSATNIIDPGDITVGYQGEVKMGGQSVDLSSGNTTVEPENLIFTELGIFNTIIFYNTGLLSLDYGVGTDPFQDWDPSIFLLPNLAISSEFNTQLYPITGFPGFTQMEVAPSVPYFEVETNGTNYTLTRAVFINQNPGVNVAQSIFFGGNPNPPLGGGAVTIQWTGTYTDPTTGQLANDYLYLNDYYFGGANTNNPVINGVPANFTFTELTTPAQFGTVPATTAFPLFPAGVVSNNYSYVDVKFAGVATNASLANPSGALSNLQGQVVISASQDLNLAGAQISGPNYMSLTSTNHFKGSAGASIFSPYSDISLGVTNGLLSVSNLLDPNQPKWSGTVQAWSSDWIEVDANGVTNEYRVLLVNPNLSPVTQPVVQNLTLHGTNLFISDIFNVIGKLFIDATRLTLTTNLNTSGFGSQDGELNWYGSTALNTVQLPNLLWVTNSGAIRAGNLAVFGSSSDVYGAFINNSLLADLGTTIWATNFENDSGFITNGPGSFILHSQTATLTNSTVIAGGDVTISSPSLVFSNVTLIAGRQLSLTASNLLTDLGGTNSFWSVGAAAISSVDSGFNLPVMPPVGDLLGTTITNFAPNGKIIDNLWAGQDRGYSTSGYRNNEAIGQLELDAKGGGQTKFVFNGTGVNGVTNAIYVDCLQLRDYAGYTNRVGTTLPALSFNTNLVIYYAQALVENGASVAEAINHFNGNHLRWLPAYAGTFSSTNLVYPDGTTNTVNVALATSDHIDSNGNGSYNTGDPAPIFTCSQVHFMTFMTNLPPLSIKLQWTTVANATNYIYYRTNLMSGTWLPFTSFAKYYCANGVVSNNVAQANSFASPLPYPSQPTNVWVFDTLSNTPHYYQVIVQPDLTFPY